MRQYWMKYWKKEQYPVEVSAFHEELRVE